MGEMFLTEDDKKHLLNEDREGAWKSHIRELVKVLGLQYDRRISSL